MNYHVYRNRSSIKIEEKLGSRIELLQRSPFVVSSANARPYRGQQFRETISTQDRRPVVRHRIDSPDSLPLIKERG